MAGRVNTRLSEVPHEYPVPIVHLELQSGERHPEWQPEKPTLVVVTADGLPVGQVYCRPGGFDRQIFLLPADGLAERGAATRRDTVSVVICTRNRPTELARCLASFSGQTRQPDEVIVVDNASDDLTTRDVVLHAGVAYIRENRPGLDIARNTGARAARSEIVAYTDDDVVLHPQWLENLVNAFDTPDIAAVTGLVLPGALDTEAQYIFETEWGFGRGYEARDFDSAYYARTRRMGCRADDIGAGASMAFRRTIFEKIGYFDERLDVGAAGCSGDSEFWYRILHFGGTCRYEPKAVAYHFHRETLEGLGRQIKAYMSGHAAALLVQYERTGESGNLHRLFRELPRHYLGKAAGRIKHGRNHSNVFLKEEIFGCFAGIFYYCRRRFLRW